jgi:hypothetical protein
MDHGETDTASKVIALRNARPQMYIYIFTMIAQRNSPYSFPKMTRFIFINNIDDTIRLQTK